MDWLEKFELELSKILETEDLELPEIEEIELIETEELELFEIPEMELFETEDIKHGGIGNGINGKQGNDNK